MGGSRARGYRDVPVVLTADDGRKTRFGVSRDGTVRFWRSRKVVTDTVLAQAVRDQHKKILCCED